MPNIGVPTMCLNMTDSEKKLHSQLSKISLEEIKPKLSHISWSEPSNILKY